MASLHVKIDWQTQTATFFGPGTFAAKEDIKQLGPARWVQAERVWRIKPFSLSLDQLLEALPDIIVEEIDSSGADKPAAIAAVSTQERSDSASDHIVQSDAAESSLASRGLPPSHSVAEVIARIRLALKSAFPSTVFVRGVLASAKAYHGRVYMEIAEPERPEERIDCVIWDEKSVCKELYQAGFMLEPDLQVMFEVRVGLNPKRSSISLTVESIVAEYTIAKLAAQRDVTNKRLQKEGLFDKNKKLMLPFLPRRLGILTSKGGTVINDFRHSLDQAEFGFELFWYPVNVQGQNAAASIVEGLNFFASHYDVDAILLFRGGGSPAELAVFNDYEVAKAICLSPLPVISAIGHQEDQSSTQDVSNVALGVPKDIGRFFADLVLDLRQRYFDSVAEISEKSQQTLEDAEEALASTSALLGNIVLQLLRSAEERFLRLSSNLPLLTRASLAQERQRLHDTATPVLALAKRAVQHRASQTVLFAQRTVNLATARYREAVQRTALLGSRLSARLETVIDQKSVALTGYEQRIGDLDPQVQLQRGFTLIRSAKAGKIVTSGSSLTKAEDVEIQFHDVSRLAQISD